MSVVIYRSLLLLCVCSKKYCVINQEYVASLLRRSVLSANRTTKRDHFVMWIVRENVLQSRAGSNS